MSTGGAAEYLCLPETLIFIIATILEYRYTVFLYGREYNFPNAIDSDLHDSNAPCAVCRAWKSTVIMYQVRNGCPSGCYLHIVIFQLTLRELSSKTTKGELILLVFTSFFPVSFFVSIPSCRLLTCCEAWYPA